jgi:hypothetical protein
VLKKTRKWLRRRFAGRPKTVFISYPKSGRTWVRLMLGKAICDHLQLELPHQGDLLRAETFSKLDARVPALDISHDGSPFLQTAAELSRSKREYAGKSVILLARDPRDVVISSWFRREKQAERHGNPFEGSISEYLRHPIHGIEKIVEFMNLWAANRHVPARFLLMRYEDVIEEPGKELRRLLEFLGFGEVSEKVVGDAVDYGSFQNMQSLERDDTLQSNRLRPVNSDDPNSTPKVRKGQPGGYVDDLDTSDIQFVDRVVAEKLDPWFGY